MATIEYGDEINFSIGVTDLDRAVRFFCDHFGFHKLFIDEQNQWAAVATFIEGVTLGFFGSRNLSRSWWGHTDIRRRRHRNGTQ